MPPNKKKRNFSELLISNQLVNLFHRSLLSSQQSPFARDPRLFTVAQNSTDRDLDMTGLAVKTLEEAADQHWAVILLSAGHFAAAVFHASKVLVHKTFHRYVVRAKRGVAQSLNDSMNKAGIAKYVRLFC